MIVSIVDSNIKEATRARCQIGVASRLNMRKYYDPIRKYKNGKECRINEFRRQFDLYWNEHHLDIQERSQKRKKARKKQNQPSSSDAANSSQEKKKRPYQLYPDYFASFRTGFYRWENKYKEDAKNWRDQKKILKFIDKLKSMAPKKPLSLHLCKEARHVLVAVYDDVLRSDALQLVALGVKLALEQVFKLLYALSGDWRYEHYG